MNSKTKTSKNKPRKIGYVRVSDKDQTENLQIDALKAAGCDAIYGDHGLSGIKTKRRGLDDVLKTLRKGDTFVVWKLDRFGRSALHLLLLLEVLHEKGAKFEATTQHFDVNTAIGRFIYTQLAGFSEFERSQLIERTKAGMAAAKARGKHIGRPRKLTPEQIKTAKQKLANRTETITSLASRYKVAPVTVSRALI